MILARLAFAIGVALFASESGEDGAIRGVVVNARDGSVSPQTEVMLRVEIDGEFIPAAGTLTDDRGAFEFTGLPTGSDFLYLPGANRDDVHYPGPRVRLNDPRTTAAVTLQVCDAVAYPSPLIIERQDILIRPQAGALQVTESLLIKNPTSTTYVGRPATEGMPPVTLSLSIPSDFDRTTFHKEFFGRNFVIVGEKVVTSIPWTPGKRDLVFTYTLPNKERFRTWTRPLDLPCEHLRLRVRHDNPQEIACSLPTSESSPGETVFESRAAIPAGDVVRVELGRLPIPWTHYARWGALAVLIGLVIVTAVALRPRRKGAPPVPAASQPPARNKRARGRKKGHSAFLSK